MSWFEDRTKLKVEYKLTLERLERLFANIKLQEQFEAKRKDLFNYYSTGFKDACKRSNGTEFLAEFNELVTNFENVKTGTCSAKEATDAIKGLNFDRKVNIIFTDIIKIVEAMFLLNVTMFACFTCFFVGMPFFFIEPLLGTAITTGTGFLTFKTLQYSLNCISELKSPSSIDDVRARELSFVQFFTPRAKEVSVELTEVVVNAV